MISDVHPDTELIEENKSLRDAYEWTFHENMELKNQITQIQELPDNKEKSSL
jgi:hypothetical protein